MDLLNSQTEFFPFRSSGIHCGKSEHDVECDGLEGTTKLFEIEFPAEKCDTFFRWF